MSVSARAADGNSSATVRIAVGSSESGMIIPKHAFADFSGARAREAPFNLKAFGTGPYTVESFTPGDAVNYKINPYYREPNKPYFDAVYLKGEWTRMDPAITRFLEQHGAVGVPLCVVFRPGRADGAVLSTVPTRAQVEAALQGDAI